MNWNILLTLIPVIMKYEPALVALYKADEPLALSLFADLKPVFAAPSLDTIMPLFVKWGPQLVTLTQQQGAQIQQFIQEVEAALGASAATPPAASGVITLGAPALDVVFSQIQAQFAQVNAQLSKLLPIPGSPGFAPPAGTLQS